MGGLVRSTKGAWAGRGNLLLLVVIGLGMYLPAQAIGAPTTSPRVRHVNTVTSTDTSSTNLPSPSATACQSLAATSFSISNTTLPPRTGFPYVWGRPGSKTRTPIATFCDAARDAAIGQYTVTVYWDNAYSIDFTTPPASLLKGPDNYDADIDLHPQLKRLNPGQQPARFAIYTAHRFYYPGVVTFTVTIAKRGQGEPFGGGFALTSGYATITSPRPVGNINSNSNISIISLRQGIHDGREMTTTLANFGTADHPIQRVDSALKKLFARRYDPWYTVGYFNQWIGGDHPFAAPGVHDFVPLTTPIVYSAITDKQTLSDARSLGEAITTALSTGALYPAVTGSILLTLANPRGFTGTSESQLQDDVPRAPMVDEIAHHARAADNLFASFQPGESGELDAVQNQPWAHSDAVSTVAATAAADQIAAFTVRTPNQGWQALMWLATENQANTSLVERAASTDLLRRMPTSMLNDCTTSDVNAINWSYDFGFMINNITVAVNQHITENGAARNWVINATTNVAYTILGLLIGLVSDGAGIAFGFATAITQPSLPGLSPGDPSIPISSTDADFEEWADEFLATILILRHDVHKMGVNHVVNVPPLPAVGAGGSHALKDRIKAQGEALGQEALAIAKDGDDQFYRFNPNGARPAAKYFVAGIVGGEECYPSVQFAWTRTIFHNVLYAYYAGKKSKGGDSASQMERPAWPPATSEDPLRPHITNRMAMIESVAARHQVASSLSQQSSNLVARKVPSEKHPLSQYVRLSTQSTGVVFSGSRLSRYLPLTFALYVCDSALCAPGRVLHTNPISVTTDATGSFHADVILPGGVTPTGKHNYIAVFATGALKTIDADTAPGDVRSGLSRIAHGEVPNQDLPLVGLVRDGIFGAIAIDHSAPPSPLPTGSSTPMPTQSPTPTPTPTPAKRGAAPYVTLLGTKGYNDAGQLAVDHSGNVVAIASNDGGDIPLHGGPSALRGKRSASTIMVRIGSSGRETFAFAIPWADEAVTTFGPGGTIVAAGAFASSNTSSFPRVGRQITPGGDLWLMVLSADGARIERSTTLGSPLTVPSKGSFATGIAVDRRGGVVIVGITLSTRFPTVNGLDVHPLHGQCPPNSPQAEFPCDGSFVLRVAPGWTKIAYSTLYGGSGNTEVAAVAVDAAGDAVVVGSTDAPDLPTLHAAQSRLGGDGPPIPTATAMPTNTPVSNATPFPTVPLETPTPPPPPTNAFAVKLGPSGTLLYATYLGGHADDTAASVALNTAGDAFIAGYKTSADFPIAHQLRDDAALTASTDGILSGFVTEISPDGSRFALSTAIGGEDNAQIQQVSIAPDGEIGFGGITSSGDLPTTPNAAEPSLIDTGDDQRLGLGRGFAGSFMPGATGYSYLSYIGHGGIVQIKGAGFDAAGLLHIIGTQQFDGAPRSIQRGWLLAQTPNAVIMSKRVGDGVTASDIGTRARTASMPQGGGTAEWPAAILFAAIDTRASMPHTRIPLQVMGLRHNYVAGQAVSAVVETVPGASVSAHVEAVAFEAGGIKETVHGIADTSGRATLTISHISTPKTAVINYVLMVTATAHGVTATRGHIDLYVSPQPH